MTQSARESAGNRENSANLTESEHHRLLADDRRKLALDILAGRTTAVGLAELASGVLAREDGVDAIDEAAVERVACQLHHVHLPLMDEFGVVDYDLETNRVVSFPSHLDFGTE